MGVTESPNRLRAAESASVRPDRNRRSFAINAVDAPWLRAQSKMALGAMDLPSLGDLRAAFVELAAQGERTRAGFTLSSSARRWMFDPHRLAELAQEVVVESPAPMGTSDAEEVITGELETLLATTTVDNSIATHFTKAGRHLVYAQNHAIGDAHLTFRIPSALVQIARGGGLPRWVDNQPATHPLWSAVAQSVRPGSNPLVGLWRDRPSRLLARPARDVDHGEPAPPRTAFRCLSRSGWQEVKAWRRENAPDASLAGLYLVILRQALSAAGLAITPETVVLYDCRRYLPGRDHVLGNFVAARSQRLGEDPHQVSENLNHTLEGARPLASLVAATAKNAIRRPRTSHAPATGRDSTCLPAFVFPPRSVELESLPWRQPDFRCLAATTGPPRASAVAATMHLLGGRLSTSICYHPDVIADSQIYPAIALIDDHPVALLERSLSR